MLSCLAMPRRDLGAGLPGIGREAHAIQRGLSRKAPASVRTVPAVTARWDSCSIDYRRSPADPPLYRHKLPLLASRFDDLQHARCELCSRNQGTSLRWPGLVPKLDVEGSSPFARSNAKGVMTGVYGVSAD